MIGSDLHKPLFGRPVRPPRRASAVAVAAMLCGVVFAAASAVVLKGDGGDGEPFAVGAIAAKPADFPAPAHPPVAQAAAAVTLAGAAGPVGAPTSGIGSAAPPARQVEIENGVTVIRAVAPGGSGSVTLKVPEPGQKASVGAPDPLLIEASASGPLPRIGRDGRRPALAYAAAPALADGRPRIAILIGGMGLDRAATAEAATQLLPAVTFGFAPYGEDLDQQAAKVRAAGHEIVLQMPMEDFGRGERPFPHMLKVDDAENLDRLHWLMGRFAGYAGVGNYLGGRLLADEGSLKPLLKDVETRGLYFVDDGTATRSLALPVSQEIGLPSVKADLVLDASADAGAIAKAFARLEQLSRERGFALGIASGRPASIAAVRRFIDNATKRSIVVVPISQAMGPAATDKTQAAR